MLKELQEKREKLVADARAALDEIRKNTDDARTAELEKRHDDIMAEHDRLTASITRELRQAQAEKNDSETRERQLREGRPPRDVVSTDDVRDDGELTYRQAFHSYLRAQGQLGAMEPEARALLQRGYETIEQRAQVAGTTTAGGYTVPTELQAVIIRTMKAWGPMYDPGVTTEMVTSGGYAMPYPTVDDTASTEAATTEGTTLADDGSGDVVFGQRQLDAYAYSTPWIRVSKELADDSLFAMEALLGDLIGERLGRLANLRCTTGSGSSAPAGIVTASTLGKTAASATAITYDEIIDLEHSVDPAYRMSPKAGFMLNDDTLKAVRKLKDGQGNYLWQAGNVQQGIPGTLNGRRYHINQAMASIATGNRVMIFGDLGKYFVRKVGSPLIGALQDKDFWPGFGIAGWIRFDGDLMDTAAVKHLKLA